MWAHRTLPRYSQKETPFSLTYGSEAIIPISKNDVTKDDRGRIKEVDKRRGSKEIASIEDANYRSKLRRYHNERSSHSIYKIGDFVLLLQNNTGSTQVWQDPHMVSEVQGRGLYKIVDAFDHSLTQTTRSTSLRDDVNLSTLLMKRIYSKTFVMILTTKDIKATHEPNTTKFEVLRDVVGPHMIPTENKHP
ncbi:hypothetical protein Tco_0700355 [Tanacetum coccineum]